MSNSPIARFWHSLDERRLQCDLCPRLCRLKDGQRGFCFGRQNQNQELILTTYGRPSGLAIDPIEKKPLYHFYPGSSILSFGTAGCNLSCQFCQNWHLSHAKQVDLQTASASPKQIAKLCRQSHCNSVAYTYNDPIVFAEYAIDTAWQCREDGINNVVVSAGVISDSAREEFFTPMDAANIDLKSFRESFYHKICGSHLQVVMDTLVYLAKQSSIWLEITTLLIPGLNDSEQELHAMMAWAAENLHINIPWHFSAFHGAGKMLRIPRTPAQTLHKAVAIARQYGFYYSYTGNIAVDEGNHSHCRHCHKPVITRLGYRILEQHIQSNGLCPNCQHQIPGHFHNQKD